MSDNGPHGAEHQIPVKKSSPRGIIVFIIIVLLLGTISFILVQRKSGNPAPYVGKYTPPLPSEDKTVGQLPELVADAQSLSTIIYGQKIKDKLVMVSAVNDSGKNDTSITTLSEEVKSIIPMANKKQLLYIADTDEADKGLHLKIKDIEPVSPEIDGKANIIYSVPPASKLEYKIDKLIISRNHQWIAWSENAPVEGGVDSHEKNHFRSFKARLNGSSLVAGTISPIKLTDEKSDNEVTISMPAVITDNGEVYFDGIKPVGYFLHAGFSGENNKKILETNEYNSQPTLAENRYILYTSFNKENKPLLPARNSTSARLEVINRNSVKIHDLLNLNSQPVVVAPGDKGEQYAHPVLISGSPGSRISIAVEVLEPDTQNNNRLIQKEIQLITSSGNSVFEKKL